MFDLVWKLTSKVFVFVFLGMLIGKTVKHSGEKPIKYFIWFSLYFLIPLFVLLSIWTNPISVTNAKEIILASFIVILFGFLLALAWTRMRKISFRQYSLPVIFMNSAYLAIPINTLIWGKQGTNVTIIYNLVITIVNFTFGIWLVSDKKSLWDILQIPVLYAVIVGIILNKMSISATPFIARLGDYVSYITLPVMLVFVGYRLGQIKPHLFNLVFEGVLLRIGGGFLIALILIYLLKLKGVNAGVCIITSSMPAAINSYIFSERYNSNANFAAAAVFIGTILTLLYIPLITYYLIN